MIELKYNFLHWFKRYYFLYVFIFLVNFQPIYPFFYENIIVTKNLTETQYQKDVYPIAFYSALVTSIIIFLFCGFCAFNYFFGLIGIGGLVISGCLWQGFIMTDLQVAEGFFGLTLGSELIVFASIYVCHEAKKNFKRLTSFMRAITLIARVLSAIVSQVIISNKYLDYGMLAFISIPVYAHSILLLLHLPLMCDSEEQPSSLSEKIFWFKSRLKESFSNKHILKWSLWSAFSLFIYSQLSSTIQPLWRERQLKNNEIPYNGGIETITSFFSLLGVLLGGMFSIDIKHEYILLSATSLLQCGLLIGFAAVNSIWDVTIFYMSLNISHNFIISVIFSLIAENVYKQGSFGLVFSFINLIFISLSCIFINVNNKLDLSVQQQFYMYGTVYFIFALFIIFNRTIKLTRYY